MATRGIQTEAVWRRRVCRAEQMVDMCRNCHARACVRERERGREREGEREREREREREYPGGGLEAEGVSRRAKR